jgi:phenylpyruvate tautomerase PptA (4-oxalocrotonate tautomerase family)
MPATRIDTRKGWIGTRRAEVLEALQRALLTGLLITEQDRCIMLTEHDDECFMVPPNKGAAYMVIEIIVFHGRSIDAKRRLYRAIAQEMRAFGAAETDIKIVLVEAALENWGLRGRPGSEIELGFEVNV